MRAEPSRLDRERQEWREAVGRWFHPLGEDSGVATFSLQQISDRYFSLEEGFRYQGEDFSPSLLAATDLTSVPQGLRWFVGRYGRHTPAALLHDALLARISPEDPERLRRWEEADRAFLLALERLGIPTIRRLLMWAAVTFGSRWRINRASATAGIVVWVVAFLAGTSFLVWGTLAGRWGVVAAAALAPLAGAALWGRQYVAGVVAGYGALFVAAPTLVGLVSYSLYRVLEWLVSRVSPRRREEYEEMPYTGF